MIARQLVSRPLWLIGGAWLVGSLILGLLGPFGTFDVLNLRNTLSFWFSVTALALAVLAAVLLGARLVFGWRRNRFLYDAVQVPAFVPLYALLLQDLIDWYANGIETFDIYTTGFAILVATLLLISLREIAYALQRSAPPEVAGATEALSPCPLADRLPDGADARIWAVSSHNHHIVVRGPGAENTVVLRFSDALRALSGRAGMQVHRSHWVADDAVAGWTRNGQRLTLYLHDGHMIPVSKTFADAVQQHWPDRERPQ